MDKNKFQNKYRIASTRLQNWDYGWNAYYFVTICTKNREYYFGSILEEKMVLSEIGKISYNCWMEIPIHFPFVSLDSFVIMPNHIHGIIIINKDDNFSKTLNNVETQNLAAPFSQEEINNQPQNLAALLLNKSLNKFGTQSRNLASIIRGFKIGVSKNSRLIIPDFAFQSRYHEHIIRSEKSLMQISNYILNNPINWKDDELNIK